MFEYLFNIHFVENGKTSTTFREEYFPCVEDAKERGKKLLSINKKFCNAFQVDVYKKSFPNWKLVVSYQ